MLEQRARHVSPEQRLVAPSVLSRSDRQTIGKGRPWSDAAAHRGRRRAVGRPLRGARGLEGHLPLALATPSIHTAASGTRRTDKVDAEGRTSVSMLALCANQQLASHLDGEQIQRWCCVGL